MMEATAPPTSTTRAGMLSEDSSSIRTIPAGRAAFGKTEVILMGSLYHGAKGPNFNMRTGIPKSQTRFPFDGRLACFNEWRRP